MHVNTSFHNSTPSDSFSSKYEFRHNFNKTHIYDINCLTSDKVEKGVDLYNQTMSNKMNHITNGNIVCRKQIKIIQINKGISKFHNVGEELLLNINEANADICILSEANLDTEDVNSIRCSKNTFKDFNIETKATKGTSNARIALIIKKDLIYERMDLKESDENAQ